MMFTVAFQAMLSFEMTSFILNVYAAMVSILSAVTLWDVKVAFISTFVAWYIMKQLNFNRRLPPGPWGIPYLGYLPFMNGPPHSWYLQKAAEYGDVFSLKLGNNLVVCIGSAKLLKDLFYRQDSTGRPHTPLNNLLGGVGIILSEGALWKKQRQFLHEKFRNLGVKLCPNQRFEKFVLMEIEELLQTLEKSDGLAVDPALILGRHMHNVICQLMMSFRFQENDEDFKMFNERITRGMELYGAIHFGEHVKHYLKLPGKQAVLQEIKRNLNDISKFHADRFRGRMEVRKNTTESYEPADLLDHYLEKIEKEEKLENDASTIFPETEPESQIVQVMNDLFSAGMETSRTTILWCLIMMLREPEAAKKVRQELNKVVQVGQIVTLEHRTTLAYIEAVIYETLRMVSVVPLGTTHVNSSPWKINGYIIPAGTHIIPLINKMNVDPETYPDPHKFKPERFIRDGKFHASENFMSFGVGQRMCLGTQLARMELFLFLANVMNNFELTLPDDEEMPGLEGMLATTHAPLPFDLCFRKIEQ